MKAEKFSISKAAPVLFAFFIMGFCDIVGFSSNYVRQDFGLSNTTANFLPFMVFVWFFIFSIPTGMIMNKLGRKRTVQISNIITIIAMTIPFIGYNFYSCLAAFALLGIGNTILQVSLNPLVSNVVAPQRLTSSLTAGQFIKAISSFSAPFIAAFAASYFGKWQSMFPIFAAITLLSALWLQLTPIAESDKPAVSTTVADVLKLLKNRTILLLFLGIVCVVGVDVGINTVTPRILMERCGLAVEDANYGVSVYFACRTVGSFIGAFLLARFSSAKFFKISMLLMTAALGAMFFSGNKIQILVLVGVIGFAIANVFSILFASAIRQLHEKTNEISGLMITGVAGGAVIPLLMGVSTDLAGSQTGAVAVISLCALYLLYCALNKRFI